MLNQEQQILCHEAEGSRVEEEATPQRWPLPLRSQLILVEAQGRVAQPCMALNLGGPPSRPHLGMGLAVFGACPCYPAGIQGSEGLRLWNVQGYLAQQRTIPPKSPHLGNLCT